jgi:hypothetical protein
MRLPSLSLSTAPGGKLRTLLLVLILTAPLAIVLLAPPAAAPAAGDELTAATMPSNEECDEPLKVKPEYFPGATVYWVCEDGKWHILYILDTPDAEKFAAYGSSNPPYRAYINSGIARGYTNGFGVASYSLRNPNGTSLVRDIGVRFIIHNRTTGATCADTNWHGTHNSYYTYEIAKDLPGTCGGTGYFENSAAGRFWSVSKQTWIRNYWVRSGQIRLVNCC